MFIIDQTAYYNKLRNIHPLEKFIFAFLTILTGLIIDDPLVSIMIMIIMSFLIIFRAKIPVKRYINMMVCPVTFLIMGVTGILFTAGTVRIEGILAFELWGIWFCITKEGLICSMELALKSMASISCLYFLILTTPVIDLITIFKKIGLPDLFIEIFTLIYRFIFILFEMANNIYLSQQSRLGYSNLKNSYYSLASLSSSVFLKAYTHSQMAYNALLCRCYDGTINVIETEYKFSLVNWFKICFVEIFLIFLSFSGVKIFG